MRFQKSRRRLGIRGIPFEGKTVVLKEPVKKSKRYTDLEATLDPYGFHPTVSSANLQLKLDPGQEAKEPFKCNEWFDITQPGAYSLVVMRELWGWNYGFVTSNLATILDPRANNRSY